MTLNFEIRKKGITASEIAGICGLSQYESDSPAHIWARKVGLEPEKEETYAMRRGKYREQATIQMIEDQLGIKITPCQTIQCQDPKYPLAIATPDGLSETKEAGELVIEVKCPSAWQSINEFVDPDDEPDGIPDRYLVQHQWQMGVCQIGRGIFGADVMRDLYIYHTEFNKRLFESLYERAAEFFRLVEKKEPPSIQTLGDARWINEYHKKQEKQELIKLSGEEEQIFRRMVQEHDDLKIKISNLEDLQQLLDGRLKEKIGKAAGIEGNGWKVTWKQAKDSTKINWEGVAKRAGASKSDIDAETETRPGSRRLLVKVEG